MAQSSGSFLDEILKRRILQIIGVYVASFWLSMELGGWMIDELDAPANLTKYIFFGSFTLLPTVIMLAWFHGQPGRDQWTFRQGLFIATNLAVAFFVIQYFVKPVDDMIEEQQFVEAGTAPGDIEATEIVSVIDEEGNELTVEVAKENYHQPVLASFWQNKTDNEDLDWLSYAGAWLVAKDLKRSPLLSVNTPYNSNSFRDQLQGRGYTNAVNEPLSLALQVAKKRATDWLLRGEFTQIGTVIQFTAYLYDVTTGEEVKQITASGDDWLNSLDQISEEIGDFLTADMTTDHNISTDLKIRDHATDSEEAIKLAIDGPQQGELRK